LEWFKQFKRDTDGDDDRLGDLIFSDSRQAVPLQAADLLAWEAQKYKKQSNGDPNGPLRPEYQRALSRLKSLDDFWQFDEPRLKHLESKLAESVKQAIAGG
jgi:hypothetical protein